MKRFIPFVLCLLTLILSWGRERQRYRFAGFQEEAKDTVFIEFCDTVYPASSFKLNRLLRCDGYYFLSFEELYRKPFGGSREIIVALSEKKMSPRPVPLPIAGSIATRGGHLVAIDLYDGSLSDFNTKSWSWENFRVDKDAVAVLYEDEDWVMRYSNKGEFGYMTWFIDKHSPSEYAFGSLFGQVHRIDSTYYEVSKTRIYEIPNPKVGFPCDSATQYESAKNVTLIGVLFKQNGYYTRHNRIMPLIQFDNEYMYEIEYFDDGRIIVGDRSRTQLIDISPEYENYYVRTDTVILGSFKSSDTLYCLLNTPTNTVLTKLDEDHLSTIHGFSKRYEVQDRHIWTDPEKSGEDILVVLASDGAEASSLIEMGKYGNRVVSIQYPQGLVPQKNDGFETLLEWLLSHWGSFKFEDAVVEEKALGGKISMLGLVPDHFTFAEGLRSMEAKQTNVIAKQIADSLFVYSEYRVRERDSIVNAVCLVWQTEDYFSPELYRAVYNELSETIYRRFGPEDAVRHTSYSEYKEWHSTPFSIILERSEHDVTVNFF